MATLLRIRVSEQMIIKLADELNGVDGVWRHFDDLDGHLAGIDECRLVLVMQQKAQPTTELLPKCGLNSRYF